MEGENDINLVDSQGAEDTKTVSTEAEGNTLGNSVPTTETEDKPVSRWRDVAKKIKNGEIGNEAPIERIYDKVIDVNLDDYRDYLGPDILKPDDQGVEFLNKRRADAQSIYEQAGNFLGQAVVGEIIGGTIEGLGYMLDLGSIVDLMKGEEVEWGNFMTEFGQSIREGTEEKLRIYEDPSATGWGKMADSGWWFSNGVSVASTLSMLIPTAGAMRAASFVGKGIGFSKGAKAVRKAVGLAEEMGTKGRWMQNGISQAVLSRNIENWMEAHGTFEDQRESMMQQTNPETGEKFTEEEATRFASEAASENWKNGWAMLLQDIPQYLAIGKVFNPITRKMENALDVASKKGVSANLKPWQQKVAASGKTFVGEGAEESYQFLISERAKLKADLDAGLINQEQYDKKLSDAFGSEDMLTSAFFGGLGGNVFQGAGKLVNKLFESKSDKEYQQGLSEMYNKMVTDDAKQVSLMFNHLAEVDQNGSPMMRKAIINEMMLNMTGKALESDKFSQFYEALQNIGEMSEEDIQTLNESSDNEFSADLAKAYLPEILKSAEKMRGMYLGFRNKYNPTTSNRLARLTLENEQLSEISNKKSDQVSSIRSSIPNLTLINNYETLELQETQDVLLARNSRLKEQIKSEESDTKKKFLQSVLDLNEEELKDAQKALDLDKKARSKKQKSAKQLDAFEDANATATKPQKILSSTEEKKAKIQYLAAKEDIIEARIIQAEAEDRKLLNNEDMAYAKTPEGARKAEEVQLNTMLDKIESIEDLESLSKTIENNTTLSSETKNSIQTRVNEKIKAAKAKKAKEDLEAKQAKIKAEKKKAAKNKASNPKVAPNTVVKTPVEEAVEDENAGEEIDFEEKRLEKDDVAIEVKTGNGKTIPLFNLGNKLYKNWILNGKKKTGMKGTYDVSNEGPWKKDKNSLTSKAVADFAKAKAGQMEIPQSVYDNLPIKISFDEKGKLNAFLPSKPSNNSSAEYKERYENNYAEQRKIIIDALYRGEKPQSEILFTSGGQLQTQVDENDVVAENNIKDLKQVKDSGKVPNIAYSDINGELYNATKIGGKAKRTEGFESTQLDVGEDENGVKKPYKGGLFAIISKADGTPFPVRLNFLRNTNEQAEALSDLLIGITVPDKAGKGAKRKYKMSSPLSTIDKATQDKIKAAMPNEVDFLPGDPTLNDLINMFVYVSEKTEGLTSGLYMSGHRLYFGNEGKYIGPDKKSASKEELVTFLRDVKRRQLSLKMWNDTKNYPGYRDFVMDNRIINTNVVVGEPEFNDSDERKVKLYMAPLVTNEVQESPEVVTSTNDIEVGDQGVANTIVEQDRPSDTEINAAIAQEFPGKMYNYGINRFDDGTATTKVGDKPIPLNDLQRIDEIIDEVNKLYSKPSVNSSEVIQDGDDIKSKKDDIADIADIERRRQEELDKTGLYEYDKKFKEFQTYGNTIKEAFDNLFEQVKNNPANKELSNLLDYINERLVAEDIQKGSGKNPLVQEYIDENQQNIEKASKSTKSRINKINAKYDAELAALQPTQASEVIQDSEWKNFVENGRVTNGSLQSIAIAIKNGKTLSPRQTAIFTDKTSEVEEILKSYQPKPQTSDIEIKYSPVDMKNYGKSYKQEDISEGGKSIVFNPYRQAFKIKNSVLTANINDIDGKTFYPISIDLSNNPEYLDYQEKKDALTAERTRLREAGEKGIEDMIKGVGTVMSMAQKRMLDSIKKELGKKNSIASFKGGDLSQPTQQSSDTQNRNSDKKSLTSQPSKKYTRKKRRLKGKAPKKSAPTKQVDNKIKPKDENGKIDTDCPF